MRSLGRTLWVAQVWLTAAATLLAGFPQLACACAAPDKASSPASTSGPHGCCCCGSGGASASPEQERPCCRNHGGMSGHRERPRMNTPLAAGLLPRGAGCVKFSQHTTDQAPAEGKTAAGRGLVPPAALFAPAVLPSLSPPVTVGPRPYPDHSPPPNPDLLTLLQRFLI
jgi:hypothetical protein